MSCSWTYLQHCLEANSLSFCFSIVLKCYQKPPDLITRECSKIKSCLHVKQKSLSCYPHVYNWSKHVQAFAKILSSWIMLWLQATKNMSILHLIFHHPPRYKMKQINIKRRLQSDNYFDFNSADKWIIIVLSIDCQHNILSYLYSLLSYRPNKYYGDKYLKLNLSIWDDPLIIWKG